MMASAPYQLKFVCSAPTDLDEIDELFGGDCWPYGIEPNRATLEAFVGYLVDDGFLDAPVALDDMFTPIVGWEE